MAVGQSAPTVYVEMKTVACTTLSFGGVVPGGTTRRIVGREAIGKEVQSGPSSTIVDHSHPPLRARKERPIAVKEMSVWAKALGILSRGWAGIKC